MLKENLMTNFNQNIITDDDLVHGTIETFRPCFAGSQDTFYVGTISFF